MSSSVEKIKERISIIDVISMYIPVVASGSNFKAKCPFHNEKTASFFISPDRGSYYCFGCGEKGDIFSFVQKFEGVDFMGSLKLLAEKTGVVLEYNTKNNEEDRQKKLYYEILEEATKFFESNLENNIDAKNYLLNRGLNNPIINSFRIGYVKNEWRSLSEYLITKGYKNKDLEIVGLIKKPSKYNDNKTTNSKYESDIFYDTFRSRIIFPISDSSGRVIAFSGRIFGINDDKIAKYLNSPDTPLFNKSNVLFGIDKAKSSIRKMGYTIVVEGQLDLILSHQAGFTNTVAVSGTAFTDHTTDNESKINNFGLIRRLSSNIIFAYDGDKAGIRAVNRSAQIALSLDMQVKIVVLPEGSDPADIIKENKDKWKDMIKNSVDIFNFHIDRICNNTNDIRLRGKQVKDIIFPLLVSIKSFTDRSTYHSAICSKTGLKSNALLEDFISYEKNKKDINLSQEKEYSKKIKNDEISRRTSLEERLLGIFHWSKKNNLDLNIEKYEKIIKERIGNTEWNSIVLKHEPSIDDLALAVEMWYGDKRDNLEKEVLEMILNLEEEILNEKLIVLLNQLHSKDKINEKIDHSKTLIDYQSIVERISNIKKMRIE